MRKVYGDAIRKDAGVTQTIKTVVDNNAKHFQRSDIKRVVSEVRGTIGKVDQRIQETVDDFFENG
jgi:phosphatidylethanolamine N-methyltransferase